MAETFRDISGMKFGSLTVIPVNTDINKIKSRWLCECSCGKRVVVSASALFEGVVRSCGCKPAAAESAAASRLDRMRPSPVIKKSFTGAVRAKRTTQRPARDLSDQKFGLLTAVRKLADTPEGIRFWHCRCECGKEVSVKETSLLRNKTQSCGCVS